MLSAANWLHGRKLATLAEGTTVALSGPKTKRVACALPARTDESITVAMRAALMERLHCTSSKAQKAALLEDLADLCSKCHSIPAVNIDAAICVSAQPICQKSEFCTVPVQMLPRPKSEKFSYLPH
ncbi:type II toxin-antitoxin system VapB family antitoxin [Neorhizobium galegae]|uniref:type II toxin-antitoxin system VapB family antitoxin n=1 Tax=Neorhizobium galegae TaxID=399 RepID=UPI00155E5B6E|nr:type II toxin-antitoxin system VapB family antitoxin [Neorhizobium galegae]